MFHIYCASEKIMKSGQLSTQIFDQGARKSDESWGLRSILKVIRPTETGKKSANIAKQDPGRARQKSHARAGRTFSQPRTILFCRSLYMSMIQ